MKDLQSYSDQQKIILKNHCNSSVNPSFGVTLIKLLNGFVIRIFVQIRYSLMSFLPAHF